MDLAGTAHFSSCLSCLRDATLSLSLEVSPFPSLCGGPSPPAPGARASVYAFTLHSKAFLHGWQGLVFMYIFCHDFE